MEFRVRRELYYWSLDQLNKLGMKLHIPIVKEYGKLKIENSILSKRNINKLIKDGLIEKYDDPRLYTIKGMKRRGFLPNLINKMIYETTSIENKEDVELSEATIKHYMRTENDKIAYRFFAVIDPIEINIINLTENKKCKHPNHPINKEMKEHETIISKKIFIEKNDFRETDDKNYYRLAPNKVVMLKYFGVVKYESHDEKIINVSITEPKKVKGVIHWISEIDSIDCVFDDLILY